MKLKKKKLKQLSLVQAANVAGATGATTGSEPPQAKALNIDLSLIRPNK